MNGCSVKTSESYCLSSGDKRKIKFILHLITRERLGQSQVFPKNIHIPWKKSTSSWWQCCRPEIPGLRKLREGRGEEKERWERGRKG